MTKFFNWLIPLIPRCREHQKWQGWDGYCSYVCPDCSKMPRYKASLEEYLKTDTIQGRAAQLLIAQGVQ